MDVPVAIYRSRIGSFIVRQSRKFSQKSFKTASKRPILHFKLLFILVVFTFFTHAKPEINHKLRLIVQVSVLQLVVQFMLAFSMACSQALIQVLSSKGFKLFTMSGVSLGL